MKKTILQIGTFTVMLVLALTLTDHFAQAYSVSPAYRPANSPFTLDYDTNTPSGNTIIILQILSGGLLYFATPVGIIMVAISGFKIVTGGAESEKMEEGKKSLTWALIGLAAIILSYSAVRFVLSFIIRSAEAVTT